MGRRRPTAPPRSIPACAGEPRPAAQKNPQCGVYPRVCGGTPESAAMAHARDGLSPRVRGNPGAAWCYALR